MAELFSFSKSPDEFYQNPSEIYQQKAVFLKDFGGSKGKVRITVESLRVFAEPPPSAPNLDDDIVYTITFSDQS